ncbi:MAG: FKBP-type peptidyl-prolyl cis-trans isomerase [Opitutaceae bacterium]
MQPQVISFHYILRDEAGEVVDTSPREQPVVFLERTGMIIDGLEKALRSMNAGDHRKVSLSPEQACGVRDETLIRNVDRSALPVEQVNVGDMFQTGEDRQAPVVRVVSIEGDKVKLDANHPMAGQRLFFEVQVMEKRTATAEEIAHGHVHGPGGHHH